MSVFEQVLTVQTLDTTADQLRHQLERLPERVARRDADRAVASLVAERTELKRRAQQLDEEVNRAEHDAAAIDIHTERLNRQLKTIISPREAEALQNELSTLASRRSDLDDVELMALETLGEIETSEATLDEREPALREAAAAAAVAQDAAEAGVAARLAELAEQRIEALSAVPAALVATYEAMRTQFAGVAISRLHGFACGGCHLDLSRSEVEAIRAQPEDDPAHCPNCDRWLLR